MPSQLLIRQVCQDKIEILGRLDDVPTMTGYILTPIVGKLDIEKPVFTRSEVEVEQIFTISIDFFLNIDSFREQSMKYGEDRFPIFMFDYRHNSKHHTIWGATAHILVDYLTKVHHYNPSRLPYTRYSKERIESFVQERKMKAFDKHKEKKIRKILDPKGKDDAER